MSHMAKTGIFILFASIRALLSVQGSQTKIISVSRKLSRLGFVIIPAGYFLINALIPVIFENNSTAFAPDSLLHTTIASSGAYCARYSAPSLILSSKREVLNTAKESALLL